MSPTEYSGYPFRRRPWMSDSGAAAASTEKKGLRGIVAGGITGGIEICITYPTEYVKTQLQLDEKTAKGGTKHYDGIIDCVKKTVRSHGFFGLYRGLSILIYGSIPKAAVRFGGFEFFKSVLIDEEGNLAPAYRAICGLGAGVAEAIIAVTPMESIKVKFINDRRLPKPRFKGFLHGVGMIVKEKGIRGIYQGLLPTVLKQGSNQAIRFFIVETCNDLYRHGDPTIKIPRYFTGIFGAAAGACSVFVNNPIDVVKTRMQGFEAHKYKGSLDCFFKILKNEGPEAFYKGVLPRLSRVCLDVGITFMVYETFMDLFRKIWPT